MPSYDIHFLDQDTSVAYDFFDIEQGQRPERAYKTQIQSPLTVSAANAREAWNKFRNKHPFFIDSEGNTYVTITPIGKEVEEDLTWQAGLDSEGNEFFEELF